MITINKEKASTIKDGRIRQQRNDLLLKSDWVALKALDTGSKIPSEWAAYRQALRDLPQQKGFPEVVEWPTAPNV